MQGCCNISLYPAAWEELVAEGAKITLYQENNIVLLTSAFYRSSKFLLYFLIITVIYFNLYCTYPNLVLYNAWLSSLCLHFTHHLSGIITIINLVETHCYNIGMAGQFLSGQNVLLSTCSFLLLRVRSRIAQPYHYHFPPEVAFSYILRVKSHTTVYCRS